MPDRDFGTSTFANVVRIVDSVVVNPPMPSDVVTDPLMTI
jgi:hypothetical protein